jgi:predicted nucleotide-binding protein
MARQSTPRLSSQVADLSPEQKRRAIPRLQRRIAELEELDPSTITDRWHDPRVAKLTQAIDRDLVEIFGSDTLDYKRYRDIADLDKGRMNYVDGVPINEIQDGFQKGITIAIATLEGIIDGFNEGLEEVEAMTSPNEPMQSAGRRVFVVHGHDDGAREAVARFLDQIGLQATILHEQPNQGLTIIEKFERYAAQVGFAVVLLTPDDLGGTQETGAQMPRARQNVVFELGYFVGKVGRGKVCLLRKGEIEGFSDFHGVVYTTLDANGGWKLALARELKAAGFDVDMNKAYGAE